MLEAMGRAVAGRGYADTSVRNVVELAGVSRETFYQHFSDKAACFLATLDASMAVLLATLEVEVLDQPGSAAERFERGLGAYLGALADHPHHARTFLVESLAAGPEATRRRYAAQERFAARVAELFDARSADDRFDCEMLVAAISSLVTSHVATGRTARIPELRAPILRLARRLAQRAS